MKLENPGKQLEGLSTVSSEVTSEYPGPSQNDKHQAPSYKSYSKEKESTRKPLHGNEDCQLKENIFQLSQGKLFCRRDLIFL